MVYTLVLIGRCDYFGFGFTTLDQKALYPFASLSSALDSVTFTSFTACGPKPYTHANTMYALLT